MATPSDHASWENQVDTNHSELAQKMVSSRTISQYYLKRFPTAKVRNSYLCFWIFFRRSPETIKYVFYFA